MQQLHSHVPYLLRAKMATANAIYPKVKGKKFLTGTQKSKRACLVNSSWLCMPHMCPIVRLDARSKSNKDMDDG